MARVPFLHRPRIALAAIALLAGLAVMIPVHSAVTGKDEAIQAVRGFVSAERPIDRILAGTALGSRPITPVRSAEASPPVPRSPRFVQPARLPPALPDAEPDLRIAWLSVTAGYPPVDLPAIVVKTRKDWTVSPRRKPARPDRMPTIEIVTRPPDPPLPAPAGIDPSEPTETAILPAAGTLPSAPAANAPRIALVITAAGLHEATTRRAIEALPAGVTLAFAPVGSRSAKLAEAAITDGHTVLVEIPMEPMNPRRDPGEALTLRTGNSGSDNVAKLDEALSSVPGASGISSYLGGKFSRSKRAAAPVVDRIAARDLFLFENQPTGRSRLGALARSRDVAYATSSTVLDADRNEARMLERLDALEMQARREGVAIGVATAYRESISALERWMTGARRRGVVFVPVTRLEEAG